MESQLRGQLKVDVSEGDDQKRSSPSLAFYAMLGLAVLPLLLAVLGAVGLLFDL